jgi:hypothetical protein
VQRAGARQTPWHGISRQIHSSTGLLSSCRPIASPSQWRGACFRHPTCTTRSTRLVRAHRSRVFTHSSAPLQATRTCGTQSEREQDLSGATRAEQRVKLMRERSLGERGRCIGERGRSSGAGSRRRKEQRAGARPFRRGNPDPRGFFVGPRTLPTSSPWPNQGTSMSYSQCIQGAPCASLEAPQ